VQNKSESAERAERNSTVIEFYNRCAASAGIKREWHSLHPHNQMNFCEAVRIIHQIIYQGE
jgi:hypothetical protein